MERIYNTCEELFDACEAQCSNFEAEAEAIKAALDHISQDFRLKTKSQTNVIIFSDAKSDTSTGKWKTG